MPTEDIRQINRLPAITCQVENGTGWVYKITDGFSYIITAGHVLGTNPEQPYQKSVNINFEALNLPQTGYVIKSLYLHDNDDPIFDCAILKYHHLSIELVEYKYNSEHIPESGIRIFGYPTQNEKGRSRIGTPLSTSYKAPHMVRRYGKERFKLLKLSGDNARIQKGYSGSAVYSTESQGIIGVLVDAKGHLHTESKVIPLFEVHKWLQQEKDNATKAVDAQKIVCQENYSNIKKKKKEIDDIYTQFKPTANWWSNEKKLEDLLEKLINLPDKLRNGLESIKAKNIELSTLIETWQANIKKLEQERNQQIDIVNAQLEDVLVPDFDDNMLSDRSPDSWFRETTKWETELENIYNDIIEKLKDCSDKYRKITPIITPLPPTHNPPPPHTISGFPWGIVLSIAILSMMIGVGVSFIAFNFLSKFEQVGNVLFTSVVIILTSITLLLLFFLADYITKNIYLPRLLNTKNVHESNT